MLDGLDYATALMAKEVGGIDALEVRLDQMERTPVVQRASNGKTKIRPQRSGMDRSSAQALLRELQREDAETKPGRTPR